MRRSSLDKGSVTAGLTNEAYDDVKKVADNLDDILLVASNLTSLTSFSVHPTEDGGDGTVEGDMNAMDWTGHSHADDLIVTALRVEYTEDLIISHKGILYYYRGAKPELLGVGGSLKTSDAYGILATVDELNLALKFPSGDLANPELGNVAARQNRFLGFDVNGEIIFSAGTAAVDASAVALVDLGSNYAAVEVEAAFAELASTGGASITQITDLGTYFTGTTVEAALQELGAVDAADRLVNVTLTDTQTLENKTLTSPVLNTGVSGTAILDEDDLVSDSNTQLATQQSIKAYVDNKVKLVMLDTPLALGGLTTTGDTWLTCDLSVSNPTIFAANPTALVINYIMTKNTTGPFFSFLGLGLRKNGTAGSHIANRVGYNYEAYDGTSLVTRSLAGQALANLDANGDFQYYLDTIAGNADSIVMYVAGYYA